MASSSSNDHHPWKYDVFLSFRGEDTRINFVSHLRAALLRNNIIQTFIDDKDLRTGEEIGPALLEAIDLSMAAVVVFSKDYASSRWCLDELVKIAQCMQARGLMVIPVFLGVSPSDVRKPMEGIFAQAFTKHEEKFGKEKVDSWKDAMFQIANLSGFDSQTTRPESELVDKINDIIMKQLLTKQPLSIYSKHLVGKNLGLTRVKELICRGGSEVRIIGIWGMPGIGKTTIATVVYNQIKSQFQDSYFVICKTQNFQINSHTSISLASIDTYVQPFCRKKVLVVLDDVNLWKQLDDLAGNTTWFGPGSRIIITSRDKQILRNNCNDIYELEGLTNDDSLQLFCRHAFKQRHPDVEFWLLSRSFVKYADGNPLALKVLGASLYGKSKREWESALSKLKRIPNKEIEDVLRVSYEGLDKEQQKMFLHFACFFCEHWRENRRWLAYVLDACDFSTEITVRDLKDKGFLNDHIEFGLVSGFGMHSLLKEMARNIVYQESAPNPGKRSRLWKVEDVCQVFNNNSGTEAIEGIFLDMGQVESVILNPHTFERMTNLKFLKFNSFKDDVHCPSGLKYLPAELRYLDWHYCPLESLPSNFEPKNLVVLNLVNSKLKKLWEEIVELGNLRKLDLSFSHSLISIDLSSATNLVSLQLFGCDNLIEVNTVRHLSQLEEVDLRSCTKIISLPSIINWKSLPRLDLTGCSALTDFPETSTSIKSLDLTKTAIREVPSFIGCLQRLVELKMNDCINLENLPSNIGTIKSLKSLDLGGCENISSLPILIDLQSLEKLNLSGCSALRSFPETSKSTKYVDLGGSAIREVPWSIAYLDRLHTLSMRDCDKIKSLPSSIWTMKSLTNLYLDGCSRLMNLSKPSENTEQLGNGQMSRLQVLSILDCKRIQSLPELPSTLRSIEASDCTALKMVFAFRFTGNSFCYHQMDEVCFFNCLKLDQDVGIPHACKLTALLSTL